MKTPLLPLLLLLSAAPAAANATSAYLAPAAAPTRSPIHSSTYSLIEQGTHLTGTVRDAAGQPLPGVNVFLKTTFDGASTDASLQ